MSDKSNWLWKFVELAILAVCCRQKKNYFPLNARCMQILALTYPNTTQWCLLQEHKPSPYFPISPYSALGWPCLFFTSQCLPLGKLLYGRQKLRQIKKLPTGDATQFGNTGSDISDNRSNWTQDLEHAFRSKEKCSL